MMNCQGGYIGKSATTTGVITVTGILSSTGCGVGLCVRNAADNRTAPMEGSDGRIVDETQHLGAE